MYEFIQGSVHSVKTDYIVINSYGIGYKIFMSKNRIKDAAGIIGKNVQLFIEMIVREHERSLYGFTYEIERDVFNALCSVKGVGPKTALTAIYNISIDEMRLAVINKDCKIFSSVSGIGRQTAERLILELSPFFKQIDAIGSPSVRIDKEIMDKAMRGLISIGFNKKNALAAIEKVDLQDSEKGNIEVIIKKAIKLMK